MAESKTRFISPDPTSEKGSILYNLVTYVPDPLGAFLNKLRRQLMPESPPARSHITVLTPRPLDDVETVWLKLQECARQISAFRIEVTDVRVFENTGVVYLAIGNGCRQLKRMHELLNMDGAACPERYPYQPHITIAQGFASAQIGRTYRMASSQWSDYDADRTFYAKDFALVQRALRNEWIDLKMLTLQSGEDCC